MCLILDANMYGVYLDDANDDLLPVRSWLRNGGKIARTRTQEFENELTGKIKQHITDLSRKGMIRMVDENKVKQEYRKLKREKAQRLRNWRSNDLHIIALAIVGEISVLASSDRLLHQDFQLAIKKAGIYQNKSHAHLLKPDICP